MKRVIIESPFAGDVVGNLKYVRAAMSDSLHRGEAPYASHALYTQPEVLNDEVLHERELGIKAGFVWGEIADLRVIYLDRGLSGGMIRGIKEAERLGQDLEFRSIPSCFEKSFLDMVRGDSRVNADEAIEWWVEAWHTQSGNIHQSLSEFLGMSLKDYQIWIAHPDHLQALIKGGDD